MKITDSLLSHVIGGGTDKWDLVEIQGGTVRQLVPEGLGDGTVTKVVQVGLGGGTDKWYQWD